MKLWCILCLISLISDANARFIDVTTLEENPKETKKIEAKDNLEPLSLSPEEAEDPVPVFLNANETSPPGGGLRSLDPKFLSPQPPLPTPCTSWWERWWTATKEWVLGS